MLQLLLHLFSLDLLAAELFYVVLGLVLLMLSDVSPRHTFFKANRRNRVLSCRTPNLKTRTKPEAQDIIVGSWFVLFRDQASTQKGLSGISWAHFCGWKTFGPLHFCVEYEWLGCLQEAMCMYPELQLCLVSWGAWSESA